MIKSKFITLNILISLFITAFFAFAQEGEKSSNPVPVSSSVAAPAEIQPAIQQLTSIVRTTDSSYNYNPVGKPDPFRPFVEIDTAAKKAVEKKEDKKDMSSIFPLQRVATEKFRVVGIAGDQIRRVAMVEDVAKKFYPLFKGTYIGLKNGRVVEIMADRVIVEERGEEKAAKRIILKLRKD